MALRGRSAWGKTLQVWEVRLSNEQEKLVCISRVTMAVLSVASQY
jgi:1,4-dihydroxy-2-naphthoyl-CoA hydrolase